MNTGQSAYSTTINLQLAGAIVAALVLVWALHQMNFRFVVGVGRGG